MYDFSGDSSNPILDLGLQFLQQKINPESKFAPEDPTRQYENRYILPSHQGQFYGGSQQPVNTQTNPVVKIIPAVRQVVSGTNTGTGQRNVSSPPLVETTTNPALDPGLRPGEVVQGGKVIGKEAPTGLNRILAGARDILEDWQGTGKDYDMQGSPTSVREGGLGRTYDPTLKKEAIAAQKAAKEKLISKQDEQEKYLRDTQRYKDIQNIERQHQIGMIDQMAQRSLELARARTQMNLDASLGYEKASPRVAQAQRKMASDAFSNEQIAMAQAASAAGQAMAHGAQRRVGRG